MVGTNNHLRMQSNRVKSFMIFNHTGLPPSAGVSLGNSELLELRLLETGFLSRFQLNP